MSEENILDVLKKIEIPKDFDCEPIASLREIVLILEELEADISPILEMKYSEQSALQKRAAVRAVFSLIEGLSYRLKQVAMEIDNILEHRLTEHERMMIIEEASSIDNSGKVQVNKARIGAAANVRFAFNMLAKVTGSEHNLNVRGCPEFCV